MLKYWEPGLQPRNFQDTIQPTTLLFAHSLYSPFRLAQSAPCPDVWAESLVSGPPMVENIVEVVFETKAQGRKSHLR